jgi:hypothetical protein
MKRRSGHRRRRNCAQLGQVAILSYDSKISNLRSDVCRRQYDRWKERLTSKSGGGKGVHPSKGEVH